MTFKQFYDKNISTAFIGAMSFLHDKCEAEDMLSDCFVKVWKKWDDLPKDLDRRNYLFRVLKNACLNRVRDQKTERKHFELYAPVQEWGGGRNRRAGTYSCNVDEADKRSIRPPSKAPAPGDPVIPARFQ